MDNQKITNQKGAIKEFVTYPNGTRRVSVTYPNGVRKDSLISPNGEKRDTIVFANNAQIPTEIASGNNMIAEKKKVSLPVGAGNEVHPSDANKKQSGARRKSSAGTAKRKSVVNFVAPPLSDPNATPPKWCFCSNIRIGAILIGILELLSLIFPIYWTVHWFIVTAGDPVISNSGSRKYGPTISRDGILAGCVISMALFMFAILFMFFGICKKRADFIVPHLVVQTFAVIGSIVGIVITSIFISIFNKKMNDQDGADGKSKDTFIFSIAMLVFCILTLVFQIYAFPIIRSCARFYNINSVDEPDEKDLPDWALATDPGVQHGAWFTTPTNGKRSK